MLEVILARTTEDLPYRRGVQDGITLALDLAKEEALELRDGLTTESGARAALTSLAIRRNEALATASRAPSSSDSRP